MQTTSELITTDRGAMLHNQTRRANSLVGILVGVFLLVAGLAATGAARAGEPVVLKSVTLAEFTQKKPMGAVPLSIPVPIQYEFSKLKGMRWNDIIWMRPDDVEPANNTNDLPVKNGFMIGKITTDVRYDKAADIFVGVEDGESMGQAKKVASDLRVDRLDAGGHRVVLISMTEDKTSKHVYAMYVATDLGDAVVRISFRPPDNSREIGEFVWAKLKRDLSAGK